MSCLYVIVDPLYSTCQLNVLLCLCYYVNHRGMHVFWLRKFFHLGMKKIKVNERFSKTQALFPNTVVPHLDTLRDLKIKVWSTDSVSRCGVLVFCQRLLSIFLIRCWQASESRYGNVHREQTHLRQTGL